MLPQQVRRQRRRQPRKTSTRPKCRGWGQSGYCDSRARQLIRRLDIENQLFRGLSRTPLLNPRWRRGGVGLGGIWKWARPRLSCSPSLASHRGSLGIERHCLAVLSRNRLHLFIRICRKSPFRPQPRGLICLGAASPRLQTR